MKPALWVPLSVGAIALSLTACSNDLPTIPSDGANAVEIAAPTNDDFDDAVIITALPFTHTVNTSLATAAGDDPSSDFCTQTPERTVWYRFTAPNDGSFNVSTVRSDYDTGIAIFTGTRGDLTVIECDGLPGSRTFQAHAGETYFIMIGASMNETEANLVLHMRPSIEVGITIDGLGRVDPSTGVVTISGTVTCSTPAFFELGGAIQQRKPFASQGFLDASGNCDGVTPWEGEVQAESGRFVPGTAQVSAGALFTANGTTEERHGEQGLTTVRLRPAHH
jgi:Family of unknown function (DUF6299)